MEEPATSTTPRAVLRVPRACPGGDALCRTEAESIRQSIVLILTTPIGTLPLRPEFGSRLHEFLFRPFTIELAAQLRFLIGEAVARWEPRIAVRDLEVRRERLKDEDVVSLCIGYSCLSGRRDADGEVTLEWDGGRWTIASPFALTGWGEP